MTGHSESPFISPNEAFRRASRILGQIRLGKIYGHTQGAVSKRLRSGKPIWAEGTDSGRPDPLLTVEAQSGISRHDLRPDLFPRVSPPTPASLPLLDDETPIEQQSPAIRASEASAGASNLADVTDHRS